MSRIFAPRRDLILPSRFRQQQGGYVVLDSYRFGGGPPPSSDPYFAQRVALLHFNDANGSTTFTDVKGKTWSAVGSAINHSGYPKFGACGLFINSPDADRITTPDHADFHFGTGDFMIEFWMKPFDLSFYKTPFDYGLVSAGAIVLQSGASDGKFNLYMSGSVICTEATAFTPNEWSFYEVNRIGTTCRIFRNGVETASGTSSASVGLSANFNFGATSAGYGVNGAFDELRITKGTADQHSASYSVPTAPFPDS